MIAEELGTFGVLFVLGTLGFIVLRGLILSAKCKDPFGSLLLIGISSMIGIQVVINLGGATGASSYYRDNTAFYKLRRIVTAAAYGVNWGYGDVIMRMNLLDKKKLYKQFQIIRTCEKKVLTLSTLFQQISKPQTFPLKGEIFY